MGFLSGVLSNIQGHLGQHKDTLDDAINTLREKKHAGKNGFNAAIGEVVAGVGRYNDKVKRSNTDVKINIEEMQNNMKTLLDQVGEYLNDNAVSGDFENVKAAEMSAGRLVHSCLDHAATLENGLYNTHYNVLDLNSNLRDKVINVKKSIFHERDRLGILHRKQHDDLLSMAKTINVVLHNLKTQLNKNIGEQVKELVYQLKALVSSILKQLNTVYHKLREYIKELTAWINQAYLAMEAPIEKVGRIVAEVSENGSWNGRGQVSQVADSIHTRLGGEIEELEKWKKEATDAVEKGIENCEKILERVQDNHKNNLQRGSRTFITKQAKELEKKGKELRKAADGAISAVKEQVGVALQEVKAMNDKLRKDLSNVRKSVEEAVKKLASTLKDNVNEDLKLLEDGVKRVFETLPDNATSFFKKFNATKSAIDKAISNLDSDLQKLDKQFGFEQIGDDIIEKTKLISALRNGTPFQDLKDYMSNLDKQVMIPLKNAMAKMGGGMERVLEYVSESSFTFALKDFVAKSKETSELQALLKVVTNPSSAPDFDTVASALRKYNIQLDNPQKYKLKDILQRYAAHVKGVVDKISGGSSGNISKAEAKDFYTAVGEIAQSVSSHSSELITAVMEKIKNQIPTEIATVVQAINAKVRTIKEGISNMDQENGVSYGKGVATNDVAGIQWLVQDFQKNIKTVIDKLSQQIENIFKKEVSPAGGIPGVGTPKYILGPELMKSFNDTFKKLDKGTLDNQGDANVLEQQLPMDASKDTVSIQKTSADIYQQYKTYVAQGEDILNALSTGRLPEGKHSGSLPTKINAVQKNGLKDLEAKEIAEIKESIFEEGERAIQSQLHYLTQLVDNAKKDSYNNKGVKTLMNELKEGLTTVSLRGVNGLQTIYAAIKSLHQELPTVFEKLSALCNTVTDQANGIKFDLTTFKKHNINIQLMQTKEMLKAIHSSDLDSAIREAYNFVNRDADALCSSTISTLTHCVDDQVSETILYLTTAARRNYVSSVKALLTAFADKVSQELKGLPDLIDKDRREGFKGFMRTLQGTINGDNTTEDNIKLLRDVAELPCGNGAQKMKAFKKLSDSFEAFFRPLYKYVFSEIRRFHKDNNDKKNPVGTDAEDYSGNLKKIYDAFNELLQHISGAKRYDYEIYGLLDTLTNAVTALLPNGFAQPNTPLIDGLTSGLQHFVGELEKVYISAYDGQKYEKDVYIYKQHIDTRGKTDIYELTPYGKNCANVLLSVIPIVGELMEINKTCMKNEWCRKSIFKNGNSNPIAKFLKYNGYDIPSSSEKEDAELRCGVTGMIIGTILTKTSSGGEKKLFTQFGQNDGTLKTLHTYLDTYYQVRHYATVFAKKQPCNVYEMLCWFAGLPCNPICDELLDSAMTELFVDPNKRPTVDSEGHGIAVTQLDAEPLLAFPLPITYDNTRAAVAGICSNAYDVLTRLLGYGDENTTYAVDFCTNSMNLQYPQSGEDCLQMVFDILRRLLPQLEFLHKQCRLGARHNGWQQCEYGKTIKTTKWPCKNHPNDEPNDQPNSEAKCQPTSPLMSYLNDCLPGHLPHQVTSIGCKYKCQTCPKSTPGMPCITPLGFRGFSGSTKKGKDLCDVLVNFLGNEHISCLFTLEPKPPKSLPEHFDFALSLVDGWHKSDKRGLRNAFQDCIDNSISDLSIQLVGTKGLLIDAIRDAYRTKHSTYVDKHHLAGYSDLSSLAMDAPCTVAGVHCAPYLGSLGCNPYMYFAQKYASQYVSWAVYLPWDFWNCLNSLYTAFCDILCADWGCRICMRGDKCKEGKHGVIEDVLKPNPTCQCTSIVDCKGVAPTLYQFGFVFGEASTLNDKTSPKKCSDFCSQLKNVLKSKYFRKLFEECDNFLYQIRFPFMSVTLSLWILSLLYLIHIIVIRLDLLHIKSHLHSPSSHRIAAQSLLAAGRVNKLGRVFYLQP